MPSSTLSVVRFLAFCLSRSARDEDTDSHGADDGDLIADDDVDDVADV